MVTSGMTFFSLQGAGPESLPCGMLALSNLSDNHIVKANLFDVGWMGAVKIEVVVWIGFFKIYIGDNEFAIA